VKTGVTTSLAVLAAALTLGACGSSSKSSTTNASLSTSSTSSTTTSTTTHHKSTKHKTHKTTKTTKTTTSKTTTSKTTTSKTTTTTHTTTSHTTTTTAALKGPMKATLTGENHNPKINTKWSYTVTATDANGKPLSGKIETAFTYNGTVVGKESPYVHDFTDGKITNQVTYPAQSLNEPIAIQVTVITSLGTKVLSWSVKAVK
jgi:hypothetical protein